MDPITSREISDLIVEMQERFDAAALVITHDIMCARITGNRVTVLIDGLNHVTGTYEKVSTYEDPKVQEFFKN